ncbi:C-C chemokine receptor type 2 [Triplophysa tibetana]|uniref:C-C chemokine receptor type 2 n=1 Tax=Triplophysa tibetana TaxID=1572043 RepID=A0A5A9PPQ1_9TELE|nr:C-C chemokine receptor type 2 [Triplophysa tibetana]
MILGIPGNLAVVVIILTRVKKKSYTLQLILNLAVSDIICLLTIPLWINNHLNGWNLGKSACRLFVIVLYLSVVSNLLTVTLMSVQRFFVGGYIAKAPGTMEPVHKIAGSPESTRKMAASLVPTRKMAASPELVVIIAATSVVPSQVVLEAFVPKVLSLEPLLRRLWLQLCGLSRLPPPGFQPSLRLHDVQTCLRLHGFQHCVPIPGFQPCLTRPSFQPSLSCPSIGLCITA